MLDAIINPAGSSTSYDDECIVIVESTLNASRAIGWYAHRQFIPGPAHFQIQRLERVDLISVEHIVVYYRAVVLQRHRRCREDHGQRVGSVASAGRRSMRAESDLSLPSHRSRIQSMADSYCIIPVNDCVVAGIPWVLRVVS